MIAKSAHFMDDLAEPHIKPASMIVDDDAAALLPDGTARGGQIITDSRLNGIKLRDAYEHVRYDW